MVDGVGSARCSDRHRRRLYVTRVGQVLSRFELDEVPTLFNVFAGDMRIVGPGPETRKYLPYCSGGPRWVFSVLRRMTDLGTLSVRDGGASLPRRKTPTDSSWNGFCRRSSTSAWNRLIGMVVCDPGLMVETLAVIVEQQNG